MKYRHTLLIILGVVLLDQFSKVYVKTHFAYGEEVNVFGTWFRLHFLENEGMAFGMKISQAQVGKILLSAFRLVAVGIGFFLLKYLIRKRFSNGVLVCGSLILAGALGNLIDSMFYGLIFSESSFHRAVVTPFGQGYGNFLYGRVVDMLYFPIASWTWPNWMPFIGGRSFEFFEPVFNVADAAISVGVIVFLLFQKRMLQIKPQHTAVAAHNTEESLQS